MKARSEGPAEIHPAPAPSPPGDGSPRYDDRTSRGLLERLATEPLLTPATVALDGVAALIAALGAIWWARGADLPEGHLNALFLFPALAVATLWLRGSYRSRLRADVLDEAGGVLAAVSLAAMVMLSLLSLTEYYERPGAVVARLWILSTIALVLGRVLRFLLIRRMRKRCRIGTPTLIVGAGIVGTHVARRLRSHPDYGLRPVGFLDAEPLSQLLHNAETPVLGTPDDLVDVVQATGARHVLVAFSSESDRELLRVRRCCQALGVDVSVIPRMFDAVNQRVALEHLGGLPLFVLRAVNPRGRSFAAKHAFDRVAAFVAVVVLSPLLIALALAVRVSSPGPILFRQRRVGRDGQVFELLKFRSMAMPQQEVPAFHLPLGSAPGGVEGVDRRTRVGTFLRRTSLDELPQLFNVLRGEMSLVGPRPERPEFVDIFRQEIERYGERHRVRAGITGWAQVNGLRGKTSILDRAEWDNYYIENWSMSLDLKILARTALAVFHRAE